MDANYGELARKVDSLLAAHPNATLPIIAEKLQTTSEIIEEALKAIEGVTFQEFQANKRLEQAFKQLGEMSPAANGPYEVTRVRQRVVIPKATVRYRIYSFWRRNADFSNQCPLVDVSRGGLAFLADLPLKPREPVSLLLKLPAIEAELQVRGRIVYSVATGITGYRYRIGVQFLPFAERRGYNSPKALDILAKLEDA
jgi:hypothetical protein